MSKYREPINAFLKKKNKSGVSHSLVFPNWFVGDQTLYALALDELGVDRCSDNEIFPAVFGEAHEIVKLKCKNAFYGFGFCRDFLVRRVVCESGKSLRETKEESVQSVINEYRITWERYIGIDFNALIDRRLTEKQLVYYTAIGLILFDDKSNDFEPNPLFLSDEQYHAWAKLQGKIIEEKGDRS